MKLKKIWDTGGRPSGPEFKACGLDLENIQFAYRNVVGSGSSSKVGAVANWAKQVFKELR